MTILEALERAKQLHAEKARDRSSEAQADTSPVKRRRLEVAPVPVAVLQFTRVNVDPKFCEHNRVLIAAAPGSEHARAIDSYRILRTRLRSRLGTDQTATLGVVSPGPNEGKSVTALNLALAFANEKRRNVFLLDLDLRNPSICKYLGISPPAELGDCLVKSSGYADAFFTVGVDNLVVGGGLHGHDNSSELLGGAALPDMMAFIKASDPSALVIIDLPPLLQSADAMVVAPHLTSMLLVIGDGVTRRDNLNRAAELLDGLPVAGVVLNRSREAVEDYYG